LIEILEARQLLEVNIIALAAQRATPKDKAAMRGCLERMKAAIERGEDYAGEDLRLHRVICEAAHNTLLSNIMNAVYRQFEQMVRVSAQLAKDLDKVYQEHVSIVEAIEAGDPEHARRVSLTHYEVIRRDLLKAIQEVVSKG